MKKTQKVILGSAVLLTVLSNTFAFNPLSSYFGNGEMNNKITQRLQDNYTSFTNNSMRAIVPKTEKTNIDKISEIIKNKIETVNTNNNNVDDVKNTLSNNTEKTVVNNILKNVRIMKPLSDNITLPINNLDVDKYHIAFYYSTITNTKLDKIRIQTTNGLTNINTNLNLSPGQNFRIVLSPNKFKILVDSKTVFSKVLSLNGKYVNLILDGNKNLIFNKTKIEYVGTDYIGLKNKLINTAPLHNSDNITVNQKEDKAIGLYTAIDKSNTKKIIWDKSKGKFIINTTTNSENILKLHLDPTLANKIDNGYSIYGILNHLRTAFNGLTFKSASIDFDGNSKTKEYVYQDTHGVNYVYQLQTNTVTNGNTKTINVNFRLIYQGTENLLGMKPIELDGDANTKEWYYQNKDYVTILQYKGDSMRRVLYAPNTKIYFNNLLTKNGVQWKVLFGLGLNTTEKDGKEYVTPLIKLYWFDNNKQRYYVKQVKDYTSFNTFNIKLNGNYIYKKDNGTVDYSNTDYLR